MQPILVSYPLELIHLDFLTLGGKADDNRGINILVVMDHFTKYAQAYVAPLYPLDIEMEVTLIEQADTSCQNYVKKLKARLKWAYQVAHENNCKESEHHKKYYDQRMRYMTLRPNELVLVHVKAPTGDHKIADQWEVTPHCVLSQLANQPVFKDQLIDAEDDENI